MLMVIFCNLKLLFFKVIVVVVGYPYFLTLASISFLLDDQPLGHSPLYSVPFQFQSVLIHRIHPLLLQIQYQEHRPAMYNGTTLRLFCLSSLGL